MLPPGPYPPGLSGASEAALVAEMTAAIRGAFTSAAAAAYLGEPVTVAAHQLGAAAVAVRDRAPDALVAAALLHDIGHVLPGADASTAYAAGTDAGHERAGAQWLSRWFGPAVTEPVRLHVAAKRYLCAVDPAYAARLSAASRRTLAGQGGPFDPDQAAAFCAEPYAVGAIALRRWDDHGKDPGVQPVRWESYLPLLRRCVRTPGA